MLRPFVAMCHRFIMVCVICEIVAGREAAAVVHRSDGAIAFLPKDGLLAPGHCLVAPLAHFTDLFDVSEEALNATMLLAKRLSEAMRASLAAGGVNVLNASGPHSEQSVLHLHFHVVPRWPGDGFTTWPIERSNVESIDDVEHRLSRWLEG
jgi:histidine triad (HIT) family protein